jgi:hypothetical protein
MLNAMLHEMLVKNKWTSWSAVVPLLMALFTLAGIEIPGVPIEMKDVPQLLGMAIIGFISKDFNAKDGAK